MSHQAQTTLITAYTLTVVSGFIIGLRIVLRGLKKERFKPDDWLMLAAFPCQIINTAFYSVIVPDGSNLVEDPSGLTPEQVQQHEYGSVFALAGRPFYMTYIWLLKGCILIYYTRLTSRTSEIKLVQATGILLVLTWIGCMLSFFLACRPFSGYFQVNPSPGAACTTATAAVITQGSTEIGTAILLMAIPLPIIARARLPMKTKIQLFAVFLFGSFDIVISAMRMVIVLQNLTQLNKLIWGQLECFAATVVANAPIIWGLYRHTRRAASSHHSSRGHSYGAAGQPASLPHNLNVHKTPGIGMSKVSKGPYSSDEAMNSESTAADSLSMSRVFLGEIGGIEKTVEVRQETYSADEERDVGGGGDIGVVRTAIYGYDGEVRGAAR